MGVVIIILAFFMAESWVVMLFIGNIHAEVPAVPPFGLFGAMWLVILVKLLVGGALVMRDNA